MKNVIKEKIHIIIDVYPTDDGGEMYWVVDYYNTDSAPECTMGGGWYLSEYAIDDDIKGWKKSYDIIIIKDYRS